jgi:hypothetical protein
VSKSHKALHRNPKTRQWLENREQVCCACYENFKTTEAGDAHRDLTKIRFTCLEPTTVGLVLLANKFGTPVWRLPNDS